MELIITTDSQTAFINSFIHLRQDVLTDGSTPVQLNALFVVQQIISLTKQLRFVSGEQSGVIQTLNVAQSEALHLMPRCEILSFFNQGDAMLMRLWCFHCVVVVFLGKATVVRKISHESKYHKSQQNNKEGRVQSTEIAVSDTMRILCNQTIFFWTQMETKGNEYIPASLQCLQILKNEHSLLVTW